MVAHILCIPIGIKNADDGSLNGPYKVLSLGLNFTIIFFLLNHAVTLTTGNNSYNTRYGGHGIIASKPTTIGVGVLSVVGLVGLLGAVAVIVVKLVKRRPKTNEKSPLL